MAVPDDADLRRLADELCAREPVGFSLDELHEAGRLATDDPASLTDRHLQHVACYERHRVFPLLLKRAAAREARTATAFTTAQAYAADQQRAATPKAPIDYDAVADGIVDVINAAIAPTAARLAVLERNYETLLADLQVARADYVAVIRRLQARDVDAAPRSAASTVQ